MRLQVVLLWLPVVFLVGCDLFQSRPPGHPCFTTYQARGFALASVSRVLILPLANESPFPHVAEEIRSALAAELQTCGAFEVVVAPHHLELPVTPAVHVDGRFSEEAMLELAHAFRVDGVLLGSVTHYHPYSPPRIGLTLQLISPGLAMVVASVDGLWDARDRVLADQARTYYRQSFNPLLALAEGDLPPPEGDLALSSPQLYQRFVCHQVTQALTRPAAPVPPPPPG